MTLLLNLFNTRMISIFSPICLALVGIPCSSFAEGGNKAISSSVSIGLGAVHAPKFLGGAEYETLAIPIVNIKYGRFTFGGINGLNYDAFKNYSYKAGVSLGYFRGREESDADYLHGLGDLDPEANLGVYIYKSFGAYYVRANLKRDFSEDVGGIRGGLAMGRAFQLTPRFSLSPTLGMSWMNDEYAQAFFGVDQQQAMASNLPVTKTGAGIESATLSVTGLYFLNRQWTFTGSLASTQLMGDAKKSPITHDSQSIMVMTSLSYRF